MTVCNDTLESKNANNLIGVDGFAYSPTIQIYQLDKLRLDFEKNAIVPLETNPFIQGFGQEVFNQSLISFNNFLLAANSNGDINMSVDYPLVKNRIDRGVAITPVEFYTFMEDAGYNPVTITNQQTSNQRRVLSLYNDHINGAFSTSTMGAFCELAPAIFGAVAGFFTAVGEIANKITDIINSIKNFSLASLLDSLKKKIMSVVDSAIEKVKNTIQNFTLEGIVSQTQQFFNTQIMYRFKELKDQAMSFFDKNNIDNFKKRIEGLISYATNIFKNPDIEEIQFLIYRFCSFITQVENIINAVKNPLETFSNRYVSAGTILGARSNYNTLSAIAAGAKRFNNDEIYGIVNNGIAFETRYGNSAPPSVAEIEGVTSWNNGAGDSRVTFVGGALNDGPESWYRVNTEVKVKLMRLQQKFGRQLRITSAYRSREKQARLHAADPANVAAPGKSLHEKGNALDVQWAGFDSQSKATFIQMAREVGFGGIGKNYATFVHIDIGPVREW